ncbi:MAG: glycosyltransferase family 1 protein [Actinobacteria bacterium]|nr:MAG: glycosyltransferase family 1 protein [Actinomycetota bacterium]
MTLRKKVLFIIRPSAGGMQKHLVDLISGLSQKSYCISVITAKNKELRAKLDGLADVFEIDMADSIKPWQDLKTIKCLRGMLKNIRPDLIHIHGNKSALLGRVAAFSFNIPIIITIHNFMSYQNASFLKRRLSSFIDRQLDKKTSITIAVSHQLKKALIEKEGLDADKIKVIHNGINPVLGDLGMINKTELGFSPNDFIILNIGRMVSFKGQKYLVEAFLKISKKIPKIKLVIVGSGPLEDELRDQIKSLGLEKSVKLITNPVDINRIYFSSDLFVLPSINEPFGLVVLEAMSAKLPVIATSSGGVVEIIDNGKDGLLVPPSDSESLALAIESLYKDKDLRQKLIFNAHAKLNDEFTLEIMVDKTNAIYQEVLGV